MQQLQILSIVIVENAKGLIASIRFNDRSKDIDMAGDRKESIYRGIEGYVRKVTSNGVR